MNCTVGVCNVDVGAGIISDATVGVGFGMNSVVAGRSDIVRVVGPVLLLARLMLYPSLALSLVS